MSEELKRESRLRSYGRRLGRLWHRATWVLGGTGLGWTLFAGLMRPRIEPLWIGPTLVGIAFASSVLRTPFEWLRAYAKQVDAELHDGALVLKTWFRTRRIPGDSVVGVIEADDGSFVVATKQGEVLHLLSPSEEVAGWLRKRRDPLGAFELEGAPDGRGMRVLFWVIAVGFISGLVANLLPETTGALVSVLTTFFAAAWASFHRANRAFRVAADGVRMGDRFFPIHEIKRLHSALWELHIELHSGKTHRFRLPSAGLRTTLMHRIREFMFAHKNAPAEVSALLERREGEELQEWVRRLARSGDEYRGAAITPEMASQTAQDTRAPLQVRVASLAAMEPELRARVADMSADPRMHEAIEAADHSPDALAEWLEQQA